MKKLFCILIAISVLIVTASADLLWEPENRFYKSHKRLCEPEERVYWVNGEEGFVTAREEPDGRPMANLKNGCLRYVYGTYEKDGVLWGLINISAGYEKELFLAAAEEAREGWVEVWVPMSHMVLKYDHISFLEDHPGQVREQEWEMILSGKNYCTYEFPCGPLRFRQEKEIQSLRVTVSLVYTDNQDRKWGYTPYFYGDEVWFCLDDLENPDLQTEDHTPDLIPAAEDGGGTELPEWEEGPSVGIWAAAVAALCGGTAVLILRMKQCETGGKRK